MKYALIGCGRISTNHIAAAKANNLEFVGICDINPQNMHDKILKFELDPIHTYTDFKEMIEKHVLCPVDTFDRSRYMSGEIAGTMCWISDTKIYCDGLADTGANVSRGQYPVINNAKASGWYIKPATMWAVSADTAHPKEAALLLDYLLNDPDMAKLQQTEKGVPVSAAAIAALNEEGLSETNEYKAIQDMIEHQDEMRLMIPNMENESIIDAFKSGADEYIFDKMTASQCAREVYHAMKDIADGQE